MFPWMRDPIAELWHGRKSSRSTDLSSKSKNSDSSSNDDTLVLESGTSDSFFVKIISLEGSVVPVTVRSDNTIENIKSVAVKHFYGYDTTRPASNFQLIHAAKIKQLSDEETLQNEGIVESDELLLVDCAQSPTPENVTETLYKGPTVEEINRATVNLPLRNFQRPPSSTECPTDFQAELRKILISLVKASAKILMYSQEAPKLYEILKERLEARYRPLNDTKAIKDLTDMGFSEKKAIKALRIRKVNVADALDWLIDHEDDTDDDDIEFPTLNLDLETAGPSSQSMCKRTSLKNACKNLFKKDTPKDSNLVYMVELLLESFRQYKKLDFKVSGKLVQVLVEMGFEEKNIIEALKVTGNHHANACMWLLGERKKSLQDLDEGLDENGPIYDAIMNNSYIRLSLNNPKILLAFLSILETPSSASAWSNDSDVSSVLHQIFRTFQSEKHAICMNNNSS